MYVVSEVTLFTLVWLLSVPCFAAAIFWPQLRNGQWDRELAYGLLMTRYLGPGLLGLVYVAMLGGIISVVGDNLNFGSQILLNDIYRRHLVKHASERHYLLAGKLAIFVVLGLSLLVVYRVHFVFDVAVFMVGLSAAEMSANWAQWWWWRFNGWARVAASFGGGLFYLAVALLFPQWPWWNRMFAAMAVSALFWISTALLTRPERTELLVRFYQRCRPLGVWGPIRKLAASNEEAAKVRHPIAAGLGLAVLGAAAVMAYIIGLSHIYVGQYGAGLAFGAGATGAGTVFLLALPRFIGSLLTAEERRANEQPSRPDGSTLHALGLIRVFSIALFGASAVLGVHAMFLHGGLTSTVIGLVTACLGFLLFWYGKEQDAGRKSESVS